MKFFSKLFISLVLIALISTLGVITWITIEPRDFPYFTKKIEAQLNNINSNFSVKIANTVLQWDGWEENISVHIKDVELLDAQANRLANLPDVRVELLFSYLFLGEIKFSEIRITEPEIHVDVSDRENLVVGVTNSEPTEMHDVKEKIAAVLGYFLSDQTANIPFKRVHLRKGKVVIKNNVQEIPFEFPEAYIELFDTEQTTLTLSFQIKDFASEKTSDFRFYLLPNDDRTFSIRGETTNAKLEFISYFLPDNEWILNLGLAFNIEANGIISAEGLVKGVNFQVITNSTLEKNIPVLTAEGAIKINELYQEQYNIPEGAVLIQLQGLNMALAERFWPPELAPDTRGWVLEHVKAGEVSKVIAQLSILPDDIVTGNISPDALAGKMEYYNLKIDYVDGLPPVTNALGSAEFSAESMIFDVKEAFINNARVVSELNITDLLNDDVSMEINGTVDGSIDDLRPFFERLSGRSGQDRKDGLENLNGNVTGNYTFSFPLIKDLPIEDIQFQANTELTNVTLPSVTDDINLSAGNFDFYASNDVLSAEGSAYLNTALADIKWEEDFAGKSEFPSQYEINSFVTATELESLGGPNFKDMVSGPISLELLIKDSQRQEIMNGTLGLKETAINIPIIGWNKKVGDPAKATFSLSKEDKKPESVLESFVLEGSGMYAKATGRIDDKENQTLINVEELKFADTDLGFKLIQSAEDDYQLNVAGTSFDARPFLKDFLNSATSQQDAINIEAELVLEKLVMANNQEFFSVEGQVLCEKSNCRTFGLKGNMLNKKEVNISLMPEAEEKIFSLLSEDGGAVLRSLDIYEQIEGGDLATSAVGPIDNPDASMQGKIIMKDFKVVKAPILAKLLTVASLSGIVDLLNGEGIIFDKLKGKYEYGSEKLVFKECKATGDSLAITVEGEIDLKANNIKIQGNVIPATTFNSIMESVPIIGDALTGGGDQSLIATRYTITGPISEPDVTVNPLSILTPGFLRNIWGDLLDDDESETSTAPSS